MSGTEVTPGVYLYAADNRALDEALTAVRRAAWHGSLEPPRWIFLRTLLERHGLEVALVGPEDVYARIRE